MRKIVQIVSDVTGESIENLRVLDLACMEGLFAIEFARHGARVVAIEAREANIEKLRFVKEVLSLDSLELFKDDVRNLRKEKYGQFDVVLCLGILYHLDVPDVCTFLERIAEVCTGLAVIDTHISMAPDRRFIYKGKEYWGSMYVEHEEPSTLDERDRALWASIDNPRSFWLTRSSLLNLLPRVGFTSAYECLNPRTWLGHDRFTFLAIKGQPQSLFSLPEANDWSDREQERPERPRLLSLLIRMSIRVSRLVPKEVRALAKRFLY